MDVTLKRTMNSTEKRLADIETILRMLIKDREKQSTVRQLWNWAKPSIIPFILGMMIGGVGWHALPSANRPQTVQATSLIMSEPEARLTFSAMEKVAGDIGNNAFHNTEAASNALYSNTPLNVRESVVESVQSFSDGTVEQYPIAMERTRNRIMIRRQ